MTEYADKYIEQKFIGRGNYGKVYLVTEYKSHHQYVAKKISLEGLKFEEIGKTMAQIQIHKNLHHPNIISFKEYFLEDDILIIIMQYCEYGDLSIYIKNRRQKNELFDESIIMNLFMQMVFGLNYLHDNKIIHRDIKPQNIFINGEGQIKLADFGISKAMEHTAEVAMTLVGTPYYLSPQACKNQGYSSKSDVWSLGCVLYQMCSLGHAFEGNNVLSLANKITKEEVQPIPTKYSKKLFQLIQWMLTKDQQSRPSAKQILEHQIFAKYSDTFIEPTKNPSQVSQKSPTKKPKPKDYYNQFLVEDVIPHHNSIKNFKVQGNSSQIKGKYTPVKRQSTADFLQISPQTTASSKLKQKCKKRMGQKLFSQMYSLMRRLKSQGFGQIQVPTHQPQIEQKIKDKYGKNQFDQAMDVAQLIYIQDNNS